MRKRLGLFFLFLPLFSINSDENLVSLDLQAKSLWEVHDYTAANKIYEQMLLLSLPVWQQSRLLYNLGTVQLAQQQINQALLSFQKIKPTTLLLPRFGYYLFLNTGIAFFQYAQTLSLLPFFSLDQQALFIEQSLKEFEQAYMLECQLQEEEQLRSSFSCQSIPLLTSWIKTAHMQLNMVFQQRGQNWIEQATTSTLATLLHNHMQKWLDLLNTIHSQEYSSTFSSSFIAYFQQQAESFISIWKVLQQKKFNINQKKIFQEALNFYLSALQDLQQKNLSLAITNWEKGIKSLTPLTFQKNKNFQQIQLNYNILLLQQTQSISALQHLLAQFSSLKGDETQLMPLKQIKEYLQLSLEELKNHRPLYARFFLLAGFSQFQSLFKKKKVTPAKILQQALDQADRSMQLLFLSRMIPNDLSRKKKIDTILKDNQHNVLIQSTPFISSVLDEQKNNFSRSKKSPSFCLQSPWDQVIPLYDRGHRAAQNAYKQFNKSSLDFQTVISNQKQTIKDWQQALRLIFHPPQESSPVSTSEKMVETFRLLQEMYLQDQSQPQQKIGELHSW